MKISNNTSIINISFWGIVLGELITVAHELGFDGTRHIYGMKTTGHVLSFFGKIPEQLGDGISLVFDCILMMFLMETLRRQKLYLFKTISSLIALEGLLFVFRIFSEGDYIGEVGAISYLLVVLVYIVILGYLCAVLISKTIGLRTAGILLSVQAITVGIQFAFELTGNGDYASLLISIIFCALTIFSSYFIKEECNYRLEGEVVEVKTLHYAQIGYVALIVLMLMFFVVF